MTGKSMAYRLTVTSLLSIAMLAACSSPTEPEAPQAPEAPESGTALPNAPEAPEIRRISDIDFASYSRDLVRIEGVNIGDPMARAVPEIEAYFSPKGGDVKDYSPLSGTKQTETSFSTFDAEGARVVLVERINMRDDSVEAQQFYAIGKKNADGSETLVDYGMKIKCARGADKGKWGTDLCP